MKRSDLIEQVGAYLAQNQHVSDESAPGMKFLRLMYIELERPTDSDVETQALKEQLRSADAAIEATNDKYSNLEDIILDVLLQGGMLPSVDDEPVMTLDIALREDPDCIEKLKTLLAGGTPDNAEQSDSSRFIAAVYSLLGVETSVGLQGLYSHLEGKAQYLSNLEKGIAQRDTQLQQLEAMVGSCLEAAGEDWQDVDDLPNIIRQLAGGFKAHDTSAPGSWVQDAIDLAHAVRGDLSPENRVMAKAAEQIILNAPRGEA